MSKQFITDDFLLNTQQGRTLFHSYAKDMPIFDYHSHLPVQDIAEDRQFKNLTEIWLDGDHYKWRAMRTHGIEEQYCTGDANDYERFVKWAQTIPNCLRNPLYHWSHLELKRYFNVDELLCPETAKSIYDHCSSLLQTPEFSVRQLLLKMNVKLVCSTDDPLDSLEYHKAIQNDPFGVTVLPTWRPDKAMAVDDLDALNQWIETLETLTGKTCNSFDDYLDALRIRQDYFHTVGCRISDHGMDKPYATNYTDLEIKIIFSRIRNKNKLNNHEKDQFRSAMLVELCKMNHEKGWAQQFHMGAIRNNNSRMFNALGPDTGFDSIGDFEIAKPLATLMDRLESQNKLARTILYNLNPRDNAVLATMLGNFQGDGIPGKIQFGSGWWFLDQKDGMTDQINTLSNLSLLRHFVGMLTDSRSFLSYPRHEYFRRILCNILGNDMQNGEIPNDVAMVGPMVSDISFNNAVRYFGIDLESKQASPAKTSSSRSAADVTA